MFNLRAIRRSTRHAAYIAYEFTHFTSALQQFAGEVWRTYRGRADCENRIKELKADFGLESFNLRDFWATEAALTATMLAYNLMSLFRMPEGNASAASRSCIARRQAWRGSQTDA